MPLPTGTVTFLFTDIEASTRLWEAEPETMRAAVARHDALLREAIEGHAGHVFKTSGDGFCVAFARATDALAAALSAQAALGAEPWPTSAPLRARMALCTGEAEARQGDYFGPPLNRCARILAAGHGGQVLLAQSVVDLVRDWLPPDVSLQSLGEHRLRDLTRPEPLAQLRHPDLLADFPPLRSLSTFPNNLPVQASSFIGRKREIDEIESLLKGTRLLTLTGAGGCGKTRLALQAAGDLLESYPDGAWLVELASLSDPAFVPEALLSALRVPEVPGRSANQLLCEYLRHRSLLLLLDNCEHVLDACAPLADALLRVSPGLRLLATSRQVLGIAGETAYRVPSLGLPDVGKLPPADALRQYEAIQLFADRAAAARPDFVLDLHTAPLVAQLCQRLDGMPLALELAAARLRALPLGVLADRLNDRFRLLTGGSRAALPRQQTLQATVEWSHRLLSEPERVLLRRLAVFAGGWTLEAAEAVAAGGAIDPSDVLELLSHLVEQSMVVMDPADHEARYRLLLTIRQYAADRLLQAGEAEAVRDRHLDCYLGLARQSYRELYGEHRADWLRRLDAEDDNLRAALQWALDRHPEAGLEFATAAARYWRFRGYYREGSAWLTRMLAAAPDAPPALRAAALIAAGNVIWYLGDYPRTQSLVEAGLALLPETGNASDRSRGEALAMLGAIAMVRGNTDGATVLFEQALAAYDAAGQPAAWVQAELAACAAHQGDYARAEELFEQALAHFRDRGDPLALATVIEKRGWAAHCRGNYAGALPALEEALALYRAHDHQRGVSGTLVHLGQVRCALAETAGAEAAFAECLAICRQTQDEDIARHALRGLGTIAGTRHQPERLARLFGAAEAIDDALGAQPPDASPLAPARAARGEAAFAALWAEGRAMSLNDAIEYALPPPL